MKFGDTLLAGGVPLQYLRSLLGGGPASLHHIEVAAVQVVDHLGSNISVPTLFCSTWKVRRRFSSFHSCSY